MNCGNIDNGNGDYNDNSVSQYKNKYADHIYKLIYLHFYLYIYIDKLFFFLFLNQILH
jgi:hypothetical protein